MTRLFLAIALFVSSFSAFASLDQDEVIKGLSGRYILEIDSDTALHFLIRSNGNVQVLNQNDEFEYTKGDISLMNSDSDWGMSGLPVAHLVFGEGSDEEARDFHILMTVQQDWGDDAKDEIAVIAVFETFNDGPNGYSSADTASYKVKKYNKKTKKYDTLN
ncbi:MAG: hypothetical protein H6624_19640 [Bdellovibrionaceae bacterium]|nr:hypothetical protein [Bdellovibrionales bacterium]MCB9086563.1 hypothetical protein [Pseudobdellovibrionaceae bacterium]